jgi:hypothetical protein
MAEMPKWIERWQTQRSAGRGRYILRTGVLWYGIPMFIAMTFFINPPAVLNARSILLNAAIWAIAGLLFGALMWWLSEWRYQRHLKTLSARDRGEDAA